MVEMKKMKVTDLIDCLTMHGSMGVEHDVPQQPDFTNQLDRQLNITVN